MYRYVMRTIDGGDAGEICLLHRISPGDLLAGGGSAAPAIHVVAVYDFDERDATPFDGLLWIKDAHGVGAGFALCLCPPGRFDLVPSGTADREGWMPYFRYRLHWADGADAGEAEYVQRIKAGESVWLSTGQQVRVLDVVEADEGKYVGLLRVEDPRSG